MAATGLFLVTFLLEHLYGNLLLYANDGGAAFVEYSHTMVHNLLIRIVEVVLFAAIILHVVQAVMLTKQNANARPVKYAVSADSGSSSWFSRNMGLTGSLILFFIIVHLRQFFLPYRIEGLAEGTNVAILVKEAFQNPLYVGLYLVSTLFLGFHLNHGFQSAFQTFGANNKNLNATLKKVGTGLALIITIGFASFPILFYFNLVGQSIIK